MSRKKTQKKRKNLLGFFFLCGLVLLLSLAIGIQFIRTKLNEREMRFDPLIGATAQRYRLDPLLVKAIIYQESRFDPWAMGGKGDTGLMQIVRKYAVADWARKTRNKMPEQIQLFDPELNIEIGCWYLSEMMKKFKTSPARDIQALCAYNAGPNMAQTWFKNYTDSENAIDKIRFPSTRKYVENITERYEYYQQNAKRNVINHIKLRNDL